MIFNKPGYDRLWTWFGLSYASWLVIPRSMMHAMPDEWQDKMAQLLEEWEDHWNFSTMDIVFHVGARCFGKFVKIPDWLSNYRRPDMDTIDSYKNQCMINDDTLQG